jgi:ribosomal protein L37AE/L43A
MDEKPTEITRDDVDRFVETLMKQEIPKYQCRKCSQTYFQSYGSHIEFCDECWFAQFPKEEVEAFYRSFF